MAEGLHEVGKGYSINGLADIIRGTDNPASVGRAAPESSLYLRNTGSGAELYQKYGSSDTDWTLMATSSGSTVEDGYIRDFIGKTGAGAETPTYSSVTQLTQNSNLEAAIGKLDSVIGNNPTAIARATNPIVPANPVNSNIEQLDNAIGITTAGNYISDNDSIGDNLTSLDNQIFQNASDISSLQSGITWIEKVKVITSDDLSSASGTSFTFSDNDGSAIPLTIGDRIVSTNASSNDAIYIVQSGAWTTVAISTNDQFFVDYNLPNGANQEGLSAYKYNGTGMEEVATFDFEVADSINLTSGYTPNSGNINPSESVESAIQKLDGNTDAINQTIGAAQGDTNLGTFTGDIISDNQNVKGALQEIETEIGSAVVQDDIISDQAVNLNIQALSTQVINGRKIITATGITTETAVDSINVDDTDAWEWDVIITEAGTPNRKRWIKISCIHNGSSGTDATDIDWDRQIRKIDGNISGLSTDVDLNGTGVNQIARLKITSTATVNARIVRRVF